MKMTSSMTALLLGGAVGAAAAYEAFAQGIIPLPNPAGTELMAVYPLQPNGQPGGGQAQVNVNQIRNATGYLLITTASVASGTVTISTATNELLMDVQPNTSTWVLPAKGVAFDAEQFQFCNVTSATFSTNTVNVIAGNSTTISGGSASVTTLAPFVCLELAYSNAASTWYRIR